MAPALTEPLSPPEKLSSSTARATPTTRSSRKLDTAVASTSSSSSASSAAGTPNTTNSIKEKRTRTTSTPTITSTRVTRSKDAHINSKQSINEPAVVATTSTEPTQAASSSEITTPTKGSVNSNEQMGVSAALNNNNNNNNETNCDPNPEASNCKDNSNEQLLADLTDDFEEAITAEKYLRKQLVDANLAKTAGDSSGEGAGGDVSEATPSGDSKDTLVAIAGDSVGDEPPVAKPEPPMESQITPDETNELKLNCVEEVKDEENVVEQQQQPAEAAPKEHKPVLEEEEIKSEIKEEFVLEKIDETLAQPQPTVEQQQPQKIGSSLVHVISVEELPPISTDSTMTASEAEDNLEERLSQLDGTAVVPPTSTDESTAVDVTLNAASSSSPPTTPIHITQQQLQQQLQQTPPTTPLSQQQVAALQNSFTPLSAVSSVNTLSSSSNTLQQAFMKESGPGTELEDQDFEDMLKTLKGFDATTGADTLCDLNVLFSEVYTTLNYEEISSQPVSTSSKPNGLKEMQVEIEKQHQSMQRKIDFMVRRMRKLQSRYMTKHTSEEIAGLFEWSARTANKGARNATTDGSSMIQLGISARPPALNWVEEKKNPVAASQMCSVLRKLETVANTQQLCTSTGVHTNVHVQAKKTNRKSQVLPDTYSTAASSSSATERKGEIVVPTYDQHIIEEVAFVAGMLQTEMREVQNAIDSDATESSSGGESADEMVTYNNQTQQPLSIAKRAAWRYSRDRAAIASRWSWLLSQIADLEIKIRQHSELHQEIIRTKGVIPTGSDDGTAKIADTPTTSTSSVNGYKVDMMSGTDSTNRKDISESGEYLNSSSRTRGFTGAQLRKRKLYQTTNIHTISKKAARPSTVKCGCQWPLLPCALCTGRSDPTAPRDLPDTMMLPDKVALLDPSYHPVLSFPEDVTNSIHFEGVTRLPDWQQRVMRCQVKSIAKSVWKAQREAAGLHSAKKYGDPTTKRRYIKKKDRLAEEKNAAAAGASGSSNNAGNGTGTLTTSATPLVANKLTKNSKKLHCHLVGDGVLLEPLSPAATNNSSSHSQSSSSNNYIHQTSDFPSLSHDQYNPNQAHSSLISNSSSKNSKHRKLSTSTTNAFYHHNNNHNNHHHHYNNSSSSQQYYNSNGNSEMSFLHTNDNWDCFAARSRTSSPTHGSSNYHKYERSLDRRNRSSYDIDNIVIPYSVAAATRVEILPYKEIPTPKWRVIDGLNDNNRNDDSSSQEIATNNISTNGLKMEDEEFIAENPSTCDTLVAAVNDVTMQDAANDETADAKKNELKKTKSPASTKKKNNIISKKVTVAEHNQIAADPPEFLLETTNSAEPVTKKIKSENATDTGEGVEESVAEKPTIDIGTATTSDASANIHQPDEPNIKTELDDEVEYTVEDISDDAMILRHEHALTEERRKFQTFLKFPWSTRSRANRRIDSRAESSGANTPDPTSPAPHTPSVGGGDQESIPSPLAPSTPLNPLDSIAETGENASVHSIPVLPVAGAFNSFNKHYERRRTTSSKKERGETERRSSTPDLRELIPPYEPLKFPLPDDVFDNLLQVMPSDYKDDSKYFEDCNNATIKSSTRSRNNFKSDASAAKRNSLKSATICDVISGNSRRQKASNEYASHKGVGGGGGMICNTEAVAGVEQLHYENGKDSAATAIEDDEMEDDDDGYPKHHLAPNDNAYEDDEYGAYVGRRRMLGDSEGESSEAEPFQDDDPNDPEWKGESEERGERMRRKL